MVGQLLVKRLLKEWRALCVCERWCHQQAVGVFVHHAINVGLTLRVVLGGRLRVCLFLGWGSYTIYWAIVIAAPTTTAVVFYCMSSMCGQDSAYVPCVAKVTLSKPLRYQPDTEWKKWTDHLASHILVCRIAEEKLLLGGESLM